METTTRTIAVGVFQDRAEAQRAIQALRRTGFEEENIGVISPGDEEVRTADETAVADEAEETKAGGGAVTGAVAGLGVGGLWGLGVVAGMLPAIGPVIAGGAFAAVLGSAAAGAAAGGLAGALIGWGIPEDEAEYYHGEVERGNTLVTVRADGRFDEAQEVLYDFGAYNVHRRQPEQAEISGGAPRRYDQAGDAGPSVRHQQRETERREERLRTAPSARPGDVEVRTDSPDRARTP